MSNQGTAQMGMTKINPASQMLIEDHLKKVLAKTAVKGWKATDNPMLPKNNHSCFGDFPATHMPKKTEAKPEPIQVEAKKTFSSKFNIHFARSLTRTVSVDSVS